MRTAVARLAATRIAHPPLLIGLAVLIVAEALLPVLGLLMPIRLLLRGWLAAFAVWSCIPIGSMTLLLIHRLTGGEWGQAVAPVLRPAAMLTPLVALALLPVLLGLRDVYPWAADPSTIPTDVGRWYLNEVAFVIRASMALAGWSLLAVIFAAGPGTQLLAGLGLAFFGLTISLVAVDWYLSLEPHYVATAFAAMIAVQQLLAALAFAVLISGPTIDGKVAGDLGGLLIATLLGVVYLELMTFIVAWYGDLPDKSAWFIKRADSGWVAVLIVAILFGAVLPFSMLLIKSIRDSQRGLRIAGSLILFGTTLHIAWLLVPAFDAQAGVIAVACAVLAILVLASLLIGSALQRVLEASHAE
jgi:hypothetical protein